MPTTSLRPLAALLAVGLAAGCVPLERLPLPAPGGGQPGPPPVYRDAPDARPVVLTGADLDPLRGADPGDVVAFAFEGGRFRQVPVQVDERFVYDVGTAYEGLRPRECGRPVYCEDVEGYVSTLGYADPGTLVGPDPDRRLDDDDEVALMLADFGARATGHPDGVEAGTGVEVTATAGGGPRYAYLYRRSDRRLDPAAGAPYVRYDPRFERGPYLTSYDRGGVPPGGGRLVREHQASNPENTTVRTDFYTAGFSDRWILDRLEIEGGPDLLDVDMIGFGPGTCERTPYTASRGEGGFLVNKEGPVRAIRRYVGYNSGPLTEMEWVFYRRYAESRTTLRVHPIPGSALYLDHTPEAAGMLYRDAAHPDGVVVDGRPDRVGRGAPRWQMLTGRQGSYVVDYDLAASGFRLPPVETVYQDDTRPRIPTCLFDESFYGAHGLWVHGRIPRTDPRNGEPAHLSLRRRFVFGGDPNEGLRELQEEVRVSARPARGGA